MPIAEHKKLYDGPTMMHGVAMRATLLHVKGHGHGAKLSGRIHRGMGKGHTKSKLKKEAERAFL